MAMQKIFSPKELYEAGALYAFTGVQVTYVRGIFKFADGRSGKASEGYQLTVKDIVQQGDEKIDSYFDIACYRKAKDKVEKWDIQEGAFINVKGIMKKKPKDTGGFFHTLTVESPVAINKASAI